MWFLCTSCALIGNKESIVIFVGHDLKYPPTRFLSGEWIISMSVYGLTLLVTVFLPYLLNIVNMSCMMNKSLNISLRWQKLILKKVKSLKNLCFHPFVTKRTVTSTPNHGLVGIELSYYVIDQSMISISIWGKCVEVKPIGNPRVNPLLYFKWRNGIDQAD